MSQIKKAAKSVSLLWAASLFGSGSTFIIYIILARKLTPENFGVFSSSLSIATVFTLIAGFGISQLWLKIFGAEGWGGIRWIKPTLQFSAISSALAVFLLSTWAVFGPHGESTRRTLLLMNFFVAGQLMVELVSSKLQLEERYKSIAAWQIIPNASRMAIIAVVFYILNQSPTEISASIIYGLVGAIILIFGVIELQKLAHGKIDLKGHAAATNNPTSIPNLRETASEAWPFGIAIFFSYIYVQSDIVMVKYMVGDHAAGQYNVAFVILTAILVFPTVLYRKFLLPKIHRWANHDRQTFQLAFKKGNAVMVLSGLAVMAVTWLTADPIINIFFGARYEESIALTKIISLSIPALFLSYSLSSTLVTKDHMRKKVKYMGVVAALNLALNFILIPKLGAAGAAWATLASNVALTAIYYMANKKHVFTADATT